MNSPGAEEPLSSGIQKQTDARCDEFEQAWLAGQSPRLEDYLSGVADAGRPHLLRLLLSIEIENRRDHQGGPLSEKQFLDLHPQLATDLEHAFRERHTLGTMRAGNADRTVQLPRSAKEELRTIEHTPTRKDSRGLRIRCPHCSNHVELIADTPYHDINCSTCGSTFSLVDREDSTRSSSPLKTIDRFDLISRLGVGGFGTVWKARDKELDRIVAVKIPRRGQLSAAEMEQFLREARAAAQLRHPHIVSVYEVGREGETLFIVSDFVRGVTLSDWLTGNRPSPWDVADLCQTVSDALHHAHQKGVVHRDLKPSNIMIDQSGNPHLMDFGLAKRDVGEVTMTVEGQIIGTPAYMSPEQAGGESHWTDRRTDVYSMGVILFEMLTGELPFRGNTQMQIHQRMTQDAPDPRHLNRHVPHDLSTICLKCLEREPGRRYASAAELRDEFERFMRGEPILARPLSAPARLIRWAKRKPMLATTASLVLFLAVAGPLTAMFVERQRSRLEELVAEKNNLIERLGTEKQGDARKITELTRQLDLWEGRANPWELWPPRQDKPPRREVIKDLWSFADATFGDKLNDSEYDTEQQVRGHLGMAMLANAANNASEAIRHFQQARDGLLLLRQQHSQQTQYAIALAECDTELAQLIGNVDRDKAAQQYESARAIRQQLATDNQSDAQLQMDWLESELNSATLAGFEAGQGHLSNAAQISRSLPSVWPTDPTAMYKFACYLTQREPILDDPKDAKRP